MFLNKFRFVLVVWLIISVPVFGQQPQGDIRQVHDPSIIKEGDTYYLFSTRGKDSTYNIRVGRARRVTGPYVDRSGKPMMEGGGTLVVAGAGRWAGPGHSAVLQERDRDYLIYHAYDTEWHGVPTLRIATLHWDSEGWPGISN